MVAYDGSKFRGFAKQPGQKTIEGVLERAFGGIRYLSRTDAGVSAVAQIVTVRKFEPEILVRLPTCIRVHKFAPGFGNPRRIVRAKEYIYVSPYFGESEKRLQFAADFLNAGERNFSALVKRSKRYGVLDAKMKLKVRFEIKEPFLIFYVRGKRFLWEQVRRLVTLLKVFALGYLSEETFVDVLRGRQLKRGIPPAPPFGLALWRVWTRVSFREIIREDAIRSWILWSLKNYAMAYRASWVLPEEGR